MYICYILSIYYEFLRICLQHGKVSSPPPGDEGTEASSKLGGFAEFNLCW